MKPKDSWAILPRHKRWQAMPYALSIYTWMPFKTAIMKVWDTGKYMRFGKLILSTLMKMDYCPLPSHLNLFLSSQWDSSLLHIYTYTHPHTFTFTNKQPVWVHKLAQEAPPSTLWSHFYLYSLHTTLIFILYITPTLTYKHAHTPSPWFIKRYIRHQRPCLHLELVVWLKHK